MNILVIGTPADVRGFSMAGVTGRVCATREAVEHCVNETLEKDPDTVLILSSGVANLIHDHCARWRRTATGPAFEILPR